MLHNQAILLELAQQNQLAKDRAHMSKFQANRLTVYPDNSYVLVQHFDAAKGKRGPTKFHPILKGPYRIINHNDHDEYTLQNLVTDKLEKFHLTLLRPFVHDGRENLRDIALRDTHEFLVERILSHKGDLKRMHSMEYLVKWVGFPDSDNTWLPHAELRDNEYLHAYLREHGLNNLIPRKHQGN